MWKNTREGHKKEKRRRGENFKTVVLGDETCTVRFEGRGTRKRVIEKTGVKGNLSSVKKPERKGNPLGKKRETLRAPSSRGDGIKAFERKEPILVLNSDPTGPSRLRFQKGGGGGGISSRENVVNSSLTMSAFANSKGSPFQYNVN